MNANTTNRRRFLAGMLSTGAALSVLSSGCMSGENKTSKSEEGFVPLFNGKDIAGWHCNLQKIGHGTGGRWQVEDGAITGEQDPPGSGNGGILMTDQEYGDFELILELNPDWGLDSGVFLRTNAKGECFQIYVDYRDRGNVGWISTEGANRVIIRPFNIFGEFNDKGDLTGFKITPDSRDIAWKPDYLVYSASPETWLKVWKIGKWNTLRVRCAGEYPHITTWINGTKMIEFDGETCPQPNYNKKTMLEKLGRKGPIGLQVHGGKGWPKGAKCRWRNIRIKPL